MVYSNAESINGFEDALNESVDEARQSGVSMADIIEKMEEKIAILHEQNYEEEDK